MRTPIYIKVPIRPDQIMEALAIMVFGCGGINKDDFALTDAKVFEIAATQIREAYGINIK
jgi:hypothetical protein